MTNPPVQGDSADSTIPGVAGANSAAHIAGDVVLVQGGKPPPLGEGAGVRGDSQRGPGVHGNSLDGNGVFGTTGSGNSGVAGTNTGGGNGVYGTSVSGNAVAGKSQTGNAGWFDGKLAVTGDVDISGKLNNPNIEGTLTATNLAGVAIVAHVWVEDCIQASTASQDHAAISAKNGQRGGNAGYFDGNIEVTGDVILTGAGTGADCAEEFNIGTTAEVEPGTVMVLDDDGNLQPSEKGYDTRVAGVISGAGDCRPVLILDRCPQPLDASPKRLPLALVGKVYCKVDAGYGAIEVGDLLATSPTPGRAMKASDPRQAFGAVIGKALRPLQSGYGLVPILIALQ